MRTTFRRKRVSITVCISLLALTGCATTATPTSQASPASEILSAAMTTPRLGAARLIVKRDSGFTGSACAIRVSLDGRPLAMLRQGQLVTAYLDTGEYIVGATSTGICGGGDAEAQVRVLAGDLKTYRISIDQGASIRIGPTAQ